MVKLIILFRAGARPAEYDERYNDFLMKLETLPGIRKKAVSIAYSGPGGVPFRAMVEVFFDSRPALEAALTSPPGVEAGYLLQDFAGPDAVILFADVMEETFGEETTGQS